ncbi:3-oxoacyl-[acyl-carrier protein] reductase [Spinactinospora alkalitolerans]|uniref:3-oxoacyl-[acyl-carrier protein] reductase n=1 Tax=Spinactinospora alkalitolerans TaxID=687207 RepID=A0A852TQU2_9ACTN|nr:SDR family oxidoreductase [Spinactinospora alkalitolerans]NYE46766.1 3-oxoacyl-[acyl-carrier protein] reductase [Spinactinospora alkalitolerans]
MSDAMHMAPERGADDARRPLALVTGAGRSAGIAASVVLDLGRAGWDVAFTYWTPYDARMEWGTDPEAPSALRKRLGGLGARALAVEADLSDPAAPAELFDTVERGLGGVTALVLAHAESVDSGLLDTTVDSFDRHFAVNARATWLLIREYGLRFRGAHGSGRIVSLTSDHTAGNLPYGASKGAVDRITLAAARELAHLGVTANAVNPGPTDTGWMTEEHKADMVGLTPLGRIGVPQDSANLITFLCSQAGGWVNGQLLHSNGGLQ